MGLTKNDVGVVAGIRLICPWAVTALWLAVIVTAVAVVTALVCIANEVPGAPAGMVTAEGTTANGEFVERFTMTPPAGATPNPARSTHPVMVAPPVATPGNDWRGLLLSVGGITVNWPEAEAPLSVALSVTGVERVTCPIGISKLARAEPPGSVIVGGTGARPGFELLKATVAPPAGTAALSCTEAKRRAPLYPTCGGSMPSNAIDTGAGGAELIVNVPVVDHAVLAFVVGEVSPCCASTR